MHQHIENRDLLLRPIAGFPAFIWHPNLDTKNLLSHLDGEEDALLDECSIGVFWQPMIPYAIH